MSIRAIRWNTRCVPEPLRLPDPALIVLIGAAGSGKSTWAANHYRRTEIVSSDHLRGVVGSGDNDLDASVDAFAVLDQILAARLRRRLLTVVDTLGLEVARRRTYLAAARAAGVPAVAVVLRTDADTCRRRNAARDRPVPAPALRSQLTRVGSTVAELESESWDRVLMVDWQPALSAHPVVESQLPEPPLNELDFVLQISRFPWGANPASWLTEVAAAAEQSGFAGIALMDHLIQIPQVERAWEPIPEPFVTLGLLAGATSRLRLGTLVSPVTFRPAGIIAKAVATLDALSGGRAFLGIGAGWWDREHAGFGLGFPSTAQRLDQLEVAIETIRALWAPGTKAYRTDRVKLPETTCYPRPIGRIPIVVGGSGERRTLRIAAQYGDACNVGSALEVLDHKIAVLKRHCAEVNRDPADVAITVLDTPIIGADREDVGRAVEKFRGRVAATTFSARYSAGTVADQIDRYRALAARGVRTVYLAPRPLTCGDDIRSLAGIPAAFRG